MAPIPPRSAGPVGVEERSTAARLRELWRTLTPAEHRRLAWSAVVACLLGVLELVGVGLLLPIVSLLVDPQQDVVLVDRVGRATGIEDPTTIAAVLAVVVGVCFVAKAGLLLAYQWWNAGFVARLEADVATRLVRRHLQAPYRFHLDHTSAEVVRDVRDGSTLAVGVSVNAVLTLFAEVASALALVLVLLVVSPVITVALGLYLGGALWLYQRMVRRRSLAASQTFYDGQRRVVDELLHTFGGAKEIYARDDQEHFARRIEARRHELVPAVRLQAFAGVAPRYVLEVLVLVGTAAAALALVAVHGAEGALPLISVFVGAGFRMGANAGRLMLGLHQIRTGLPAVDAVVAAERLPRRAEPAADAAPLVLPDNRSSQPLVAFREVGFAYDDHRPDVLHDVSFEVPAGTSFGIVGLSGAGKTTTLDLLLGLLEPTTGEVVVGGHTDLATVGEAWRARVGYVPQDVFLLDASIEENVVFGEEPGAVDHDRVEKALRDSELAGWVEQQPDGLATSVGERGARLSGGQRQRIGLARALYRDPAVLVLDEATSSLDVDTEQRIAETVARMREQVTVVVVAHRLSTVRRCDVVCLLEGGRVAGIGGFDHLRRTNAAFARLAELAGIPQAEPVVVR
jgi:ABC-type multidrug transport system fused ATPase/permease subunit